jgi:hypothetical protein
MAQEPTQMPRFLGPTALIVAAWQNAKLLAPSVVTSVAGTALKLSPTTPITVA